MARETVVRLLDDLDGSAAETSIRFAWSGVEYEIDLSQANAHAFETAVAPYLAAAQRVRRRPAGVRGGVRRVSGGKPDQSVVRAWAAENGYAVSTRGRLSSTLIEAYEAAQSGSAAPEAAVAAPRAARKAPARKAAATKAPARKAAARKAPATKAARRGRPAARG
jgi:hypothetical protein